MKQIWMAGILALAGLMMIGGCETESERLADMAEHTVEMQSKQNASIARTNEELAQLNRDVQAERKELSQGFKQLDDDRREIHKQRRSELAWAESFQFLTIIIAATTPLFLCAYLVWAATRQTTNYEAVNEILIQELVSPKPRLITGPNLPAVENSSDPHTGVSTTQANNEGG